MTYAKRGTFNRRLLRAAGSAIGRAAGRRLAQKYKYRGNGSKTKQSHRHQQTEDTSAVHSGIESRVIYAKLNHKQPRNIEKGSKYRYNEITSGIISGEQGFQNVSAIAYAATAKQVMFTSGSAAGTVLPPIDEGGMALVQLNPYAKGTGSTLLPSQEYLNNQVFIDNVVFEIDLANFENLATIVDLYVCTPKEWSRTDATTDFAQGLIQQSAGITTVASNTVTPAMKTGSVNSAYPGTKPRQSQEFLRKWRVMRVHHVDLAGGANERINLVVTLNLTVKIDKILSMNQNPLVIAPTIAQLPVNYMREGTVEVFAITRGGVVNITHTDAPAFTAPSYGTTKIGWVCNKRYTMQPLIGNASRTSLYEGATAIAQVHPILEQKFMDHEDNPTSVEQS